MQKRVDGCISFVYNKELQKLSKKRAETKYCPFRQGNKEQK